MYFFPLDGRAPWSATAAVAAKRALYEGFRKATEAGVSSAGAGVVDDERSGATILPDAFARGFATACAIGAIADADFDAGRCPATTVPAAACGAAYWTVVVHYNPEGSTGLNTWHASRLRQLSDDLHDPQAPRLLVNLVVPPTRGQIAGGIGAYDRHILPELTPRAIAQLVSAGVDPHLWGIEGFEHAGHYPPVIAAAARGDRCEGCLVRAAGHRDSTTLARMAAGLSVPGVIGVILGRAAFFDLVANWIQGRTTRSAAVAAVAAQFAWWVRQLEAPAAQRSTTRCLSFARSV